MARRIAHRGVKGPRRQTNWISSADAGFSTITTGVKSLNSTFLPDGGAGVVKAPLTVTRTVGQITIAPPTSQASDEALIGAFGICVVNDLAITAGAASIPGPVTNADWDGWFVHKFFCFNYEFHTAVSTLISSVTYQFDSKAMRKVLDESYGLAVMFENSGGQSIRVLPQFRMLMKLH